MPERHKNLGELATKPAGVRILVVEDHADTAKAIALLLQRSGHTVSVALNKAEALKMAEGTEFDILMCDLVLPDGDGFELIDQLRAGRTFHAICVSGHTPDAAGLRGKQNGFDLHLTKPVDLDKLESFISSRIQTPQRSAQ